MWLKDPKTKEPSVSLTMMTLAFLGTFVGGCLQMAHKIDNVSIMLELFGTTAALYFGRRFSINGKSYEAASTQTKESQ